MRNILIVLNTLLMFALTGAGIHALFFSRQPEVRAAKPVNKKNLPSSKRTVSVHRKIETAPPSREELIRTITTANIFSQNRSPNSGMRGRSGNTALSLVGTFKIGKTEGAIIRIKGSQSSFVSMGGPFPGMMPEMPPGMMPGQQNGGNNGGGPRRERNSGGNGNRMRFGPMLRQMTQQNGQQNDASSGTTGVRQYVKVGETLSTGHTLVEVTRVKAVLTRGGSKLELTLEDPSQNQQKNVSARKVNAGQQFMQNSLNTQRQMMQMMQMMQHGINMNNRMMMNNMRQGGGQNNGGSRGGNRR